MSRAKRSNGQTEIDANTAFFTYGLAPIAKKQRVVKQADVEEVSIKTAKKTSVRSSRAPAPKANRAAGIVDPASGIIGAVLFDPEAPTVPLDVMLVLVEDTSDRYYIIQCISNVKGEFYTFTRWGATGRAGMNQLFGPFKTIDEAKVIFCEKFDEKTGNDWDDVAMNLNVKAKAGRGRRVAGGFVKQEGMYDMLAQNPATAVAKAKTAGIKWEYYVNDNVAGKVNGWHPYDKENIDIMEGIFNMYQQNPFVNLRNRFVTSDASGYSYRIDLANMKQTNTATNKTRDIRRIDPTTPGVITFTQAAFVAPTPLPVQLFNFATPALLPIKPYVRRARRARKVY